MVLINKIFIIVSMALLVSGAPNSIPSQYQKKINKHIKDVYKNEDFTLVPVEREHGVMMRILDSSLASLGLVYFNSIKTCRVGGCTASTQVSPKGSHEFFDVVILMDSDTTIKRIKILKYFSDYGYEITSKRYLKKFYKVTPCQLSGETELDAISGATISSNALIDEIRSLCD